MQISIICGVSLFELTVHTLDISYLLVPDLLTNNWTTSTGKINTASVGALAPVKVIGHHLGRCIRGRPPLI